MSLRVRTEGRLTCGFCGTPYHPPPQVRRTMTCGRPECVRDHRKLLRKRSSVSAFPREEYRRLLERLSDLGMEKEWFLVYVLGETGMLVSELLRIRPADLFFEGPEKKILMHPNLSSKGPRIFNPVSGAVAGTIERWVKSKNVSKWERFFPCSKRGAQKMFERALKRAKVVGSWGTRSLRHMFALTVAMATDSEIAVARALRMKGASSARIYVKMTRELMEKGA